MIQFEYKVLNVATKGVWDASIDSEKLVHTLNELGLLGWEAVTTTDTNLVNGMSRSLIIILKRPINNQ